MPNLISNVSEDSSCVHNRRIETFFVGAAFVGDYTVFDLRPSETVNTLPTATAAPVIVVDAMFSVWGISPI